MRIALIIGHSRLKSGLYTSADGTKFGGGNEYLFNKSLAPQIAKYLRKNGHIVDIIKCPENKLEVSIEERSYKLSRVNKDTYALVIELHLNAATTAKAEGCEVIYVSKNGKKYADAVQKNLATIFKHRGTKLRDDLYMLNQTIPTCIIVETFFCTNPKEWNFSMKNKNKISKLIADGIGK